jgi:N,N'-diacetyllegionaminate synthase
MSGIVVIAEAGVNHNGSLETAKRLIDVAAGSGADIVKFQTFNADDMVTVDAQTARYQQPSNGKTISQHEMLKNLELTYSDHQELADYCQTQELEFFSTAFDKPSIDLLVELGQKKFKVPSGEITNTPYLRYLASFGYPMIVSTGMSNIEEIEFAIETIEKVGNRRENITLMHCTSAYPAPMEELNLRAICRMKDHFNIPIGYSDHSKGIEASIAAVAVGATVIEKHFTLSNDMPGPDHSASLEPDELTALVKAVRNIDTAMGSGVKEISESEKENIDVVRKSVVASCEIKKGEILTVENLTTKRPGTGISPNHWDELIGSVAKKDFSKDDLIVI